ncbi:MAG TPA: hypothetical protein VMR52_09165 [Dehalococcoidia bacterium]|nr:hypothetical protein [Dehalococcoidia bacterium]
MDAETVRKQLQEVQAELQRVEATREVLVNLVRGYEGWLRLNEKGAVGVQASLLSPEAERATKKRSNRTQGTMSVRGAIIQVLKGAHGEPLHASEIWKRAFNLGARTEVAEPKDLVDLNLISLRKRYPEIQRVEPRTYVWRNGRNGGSD